VTPSRLVLEARQRRRVAPAEASLLAAFSAMFVLAGHYDVQSVLDQMEMAVAVLGSGAWQFEEIGQEIVDRMGRRDGVERDNARIAFLHAVCLGDAFGIALGLDGQLLWVDQLVAPQAAFAGMDRIRQAYRHAVEQRYRFFSYGDAMLLTRDERQSDAN